MSTLEIIGFICGVLGVYLTLKENIYCFPISIINVSISLVLFYSQKLYADSIQQIVYFFLISYGWMKWDTSKNKVFIQVSKSSKKQLINVVLIAIVISLLLGSLLQHFTDASFPWIDSSATAASFVAQWLIAKKKIENWVIWMLVNITYIGIYINKHLYLYAILFFIYFALAVWGYSSWKKQLTTNNNAV